MSVAESIKQLRESHDLTQEQFGKIAGVSSMAVSQWENGRAVPRMRSINQISEYFGVPKSMIVDDVHYMHIALNKQLLTSDERELMHLYQKMDSKRRELLLNTARSFVALNDGD